MGEKPVKTPPFFLVKMLQIVAFFIRHSQIIVVASTKNVLYKRPFYGIIIHEEGIAKPKHSLGFVSF